MRYVIALIIFACLQVRVCGQCYDLRFTLIQNDQTQGGIFAAKVQIKKTIGSSFEMGTSNIRFDYNADGLALPVLQSTAIIPMNFNSGSYNPMTATGSGYGFFSLNIDLAGQASGTPVISSNQWTDVAIVEFVITDIHQTSQLVFRTSSPGNTIIFKDDHQTILDQGKFTGLDRPLAKKLRPVHLFLKNKNVTVYPNPAAHYVIIQNHDYLPEDVAVLNVLDINGKTIQTQKMFGPENIIHLENLDNGYYLLQVSRESGVMTTKQLLIIQ